MRFGSLVLTAALLAPLPTVAQETEQERTDRTLIVGFIEDNLSGAGRQVVLRGFSGALSSRATADELTIADDLGVWLKLENIVLDWDRSKLFSGVVQVNELSAEKITLSRLPEPVETSPTPEAGGFTLPQFPVAVDIAQIEATTVILGKDVLGDQATATVSAALTINDDIAAAKLLLHRTDNGPREDISLDVSFSDQSAKIAFKADEAAGGFLTTRLGLPDAPAILLTAYGQGPIDDFTTAISLQTNGLPRLGGTVTIKGQGELGTAFGADISGDLAPIFAPEFADFFGSELSVKLSGQKLADGALTLDQLGLQTRSMSLDGAAKIAPDGLPESFSLRGHIADPDGAAVALPIKNASTTVQSADVTLSYDSKDGEAWTAYIQSQGVQSASLRAQALTLDGKGTIQRDALASIIGAKVDGTFAVSGQGLEFADPGLDRAIGQTATLTTEFSWTQGAGLISIPSVKANFGDTELSGSGTIQGLETGYHVQGSADLDAQDISRFSGLTNRDLAGAAKAQLSGKGSLLGGDFDLSASVSGENLKIDQPQIDAILNGSSQLTVAATRDLSGLNIPSFQLTTANLSSNGSIRLGSLQSEAQVSVTAVDLGQIIPQVTGGVVADLRLTGPLLTGSAIVTGNATATDLAIGQAEVDRALAGKTALTLAVELQNGGVILNSVELLAAAGTATLSGRITGDQAELSIDGDLPDLSVIRDGMSGRVFGTISVDGSLSGPDVDLISDVTAAGLQIGIANVDRQLTGISHFTAKGHLAQTVLTLEDSDLSLASGNYRLIGRIDPSDADLKLSANIPDLRKLRPDIGGSLTLDTTIQGDILARKIAVKTLGTATDLATGIDQADQILMGQITASAEGALDQTKLTLETAKVILPAGTIGASGQLDPDSADLAITFDLPDLSRLSGPFKGQTNGTLVLNGPFSELGLALTAATQNLRLGQSQVDALLAGRSTLAANAVLKDGQLRLENLNFVAPQLSAQASGEIGSSARKLNLAAQINNAGVVIPEFPGRLTLNGTAQELPIGYALDIDVRGPGGIDAKIAGSVGTTFKTADLRISGTGQAGLANPFLGTRVLAGGLVADLTLSGPIAATSLSGKVTLRNGRLADPSFPFTLLGIAADATLQRGTMALDASANISTGGTLSAKGTVGLATPVRTDLTITALAAVIRDPELFQTRANADLRLTGPLIGGGAALTGRVALVETEVRIASTGLGSSADVPGLRHVNEPAAVTQTRRRAGLIADANGQGATSNAAIALNVTISAPNRLFLRGRGLDAELGGQLIIAGTSENVIPSGQFSLIRGRMDILGRRLDLNSATLTLQGSFDPTISLSASTKNDDVTTTIAIEGSASEPEVTFSSSPDLPQEEIVAQLIFGKRLQSLSPFQALQLANAVATLAGRGGDGISARLRQGIGLDDLDVQTTAEGNTQLTAGKYLSEKLYSEVTVDQTGKTQIDLNLDLTDTITIKGRVGNDGNTGIGLFYEKDY